MATKAQLEALAKGREKLAKSRKLNGLKDFFKKKSDKKTKPVAKKTTIKKSTKKHTSAKKTVRKALTETKKKVRKTTSKIFSNARKKAVKETNKALASTKKLLQKKGLAGAKKISIKEVLENSYSTWIITKVKQGYGGKVRIDARRRYHEADGVNFFSEWCSLKYANKIRKENGYKDLSITEY